MQKFILIVFFQFALLVSAYSQKYDFPLNISANHRYMVDQKGKPFFYNGDTGWKLFLKLDNAAVIEYLVDRKNKNFTVVQTMLTGFAGEKNQFGQMPFKDPNDFSTISKDYLDHVAWVVQQADSLGLLIAIAPLWAGCCGEGYAGKGAVDTKSYMSVNGAIKCRAFGEFIGKRFSKYKNILWIMGGDIDPFEDREMMNQLALGLKSQAPHQLITYHPSSSHSSSDDWPGTTWLDIVMTYTYFRGFNKAWTQNMPDVYELNFREYVRAPVKPFFLGESTYEKEHDSWGSAMQVRKQAYWSVLSGGAGNAYGTPLWDFPDNWRSFLNLPGGNSLQYYFSLFQSRPWFRIIPDPESSIITGGAGEYAHNDYAVAGADEGGRFIIAYIPSGRTFTINTFKLKGKKVKASWYNPENGITSFIGEYLNPGGNYKDPSVISFKTPDDKDWVLLLDSSD